MPHLFSKSPKTITFSYTPSRISVKQAHRQTPYTTYRISPYPTHTQLFFTSGLDYRKRNFQVQINFDKLKPQFIYGLHQTTDSFDAKKRFLPDYVLEILDPHTHSATQLHTHILTILLSSLQQQYLHINIFQKFTVLRIYKTSHITENQLYKTTLHSLKCIHLPPCHWISPLYLIPDFKLFPLFPVKSIIVYNRKL